MVKPKTSVNIEIPNSILRQLLTASELRMLKNRWQIINKLEEGLSIRKIADELKVGTDTVVRISKMMKEENLQKALDSQKLNLKKFKTPTPWVFGKSE